MAFADVGKLDRVFDTFQCKDRVGTGNGLVLVQGAVQVIVGGFLVYEEHFLCGQSVYGIDQLRVVAQGNAVIGQRFCVGIIQAAGGDKQGAAVHRDKGISNGQRGTGQVACAHVGQPAHTVQTSHSQGGGTGFFQLVTHHGNALGGGGAGLLNSQQLAGGVGQAGAGGQALPQGGDDILAFQLGAALGQSGGIAVGNGGRHAAAIQQQGLACGKMGGQVLFHGGHPGGTGVHALNFGTGQLTVTLNIKAAIAPQGAAGQGDNEGGVLAGKAGEKRQAVVISGQIFTGVWVAGHQQNTVGTGCLGSGAQSGDFFIGRQNSPLLICRMLNKSILTCFHKRSIRGAVQHSAQQRQAAALQKVSRLAQLLVGNAAALYHKQGTVTYLGKAESVTAFAQGWSIYQKISKLWCTAFHHAGKTGVFQQQGRAAGGAGGRNQAGAADLGVVENFLQRNAAGKIVCQTRHFVFTGQPALAADAGMAQVTVNQQAALAKPGKQLPELQSQSSFTFLRGSAGEQNDFGVWGCLFKTQAQQIQGFNRPGCQLRQVVQSKFFHGRPPFRVWRRRGVASGMQASGEEPRQRARSSAV